MHFHPLFTNTIGSWHLGYKGIHTSFVLAIFQSLDFRYFPRISFISSFLSRPEVGRISCCTRWNSLFSVLARWVSLPKRFDPVPWRYSYHCHFLKEAITWRIRIQLAHPPLFGEKCQRKNVYGETANNSWHLCWQRNVEVCMPSIFLDGIRE